MREPLQYARAACDTLMRRFAAPDLPPKGHFHYHQGVFLSGMYETWLLCGEERYFQYIRDWVDSVFDGDGNIRQYIHADLDDIQPGILLFPIWERTGDPFYRRCLEAVYRQVTDIPKNSEGGYWHKNQPAGPDVAGRTVHGRPFLHAVRQTIPSAAAAGGDRPAGPADAG